MATSSVEFMRHSSVQIRGGAPDYQNYLCSCNNVLFELISQRYERGATLITSNLPFDEWTETFGSERLTGALLDRLTHHVNILEMNGDSYRLAQSRGRKGIAINQGQDRLALAGQSAQAPASYIESAGTWAPSAFLVPDSGTLKWPTFAPPHGRFLLRR